MIIGIVDHILLPVLPIVRCFRAAMTRGLRSDSPPPGD
jgi:hypothetical protein